ncbi:hypothetical protein HYPSUDRAFT_214684 [Hypholoma sublateritium FD-334 SS-4]|uniref:Uncharacterized protein n=1 Tax=Hypholoma sublateritium (strain FD-334 SS-4) TaxID=945553 RepID=A0A0D2MKJ9_HYPSF|nr:hypothetical protein HYPSUDRAFT_214684 [Hypholoma sublateritium FD-334 SS-4]
MGSTAEAPVRLVCPTARLRSPGAAARGDTHLAQPLGAQATTKQAALRQRPSGTGSGAHARKWRRPRGHGDYSAAPRSIAGTRVPPAPRSTPPRHERADRASAWRSARRARVRARTLSNAVSARHTSRRLAAHLRGRTAACLTARVRPASAPRPNRTFHLGSLRGGGGVTRLGSAHARPRRHALTDRWYDDERVSSDHALGQRCPEARRGAPPACPPWLASRRGTQFHHRGTRDAVQAGCLS